jgi:hypothetical protein
MLVMKVTFHEKSLKEALQILRAIPKAVPRVFRRAINRSVDMAATDFKRRAGEEITLRKRDIAKGISKRKATYANLTGTIGAKEHRPGLIDYPGTRQFKRAGVKYRISRREGRKTIPHGFIATMTSGHRAVFTRARKTRLPIGEKRGPSIWQVITNTPGLLRQATDTSAEKFGKLVDDQIGVEFKRWKR